MNKKEILVPFIVIGLTALFAGICIGVFLTKGKSKKWVARKMKIGGLLLTLTAASCSGGGEVMCYDTVASNTIWLLAQGENGVEINLDTNNVLVGQINEVYGSEFSFVIKDEEKKKVQQGLLQPVDGEFNQSNEDFKIELNKNLSPGKYNISFYASGIAGQDTTYASHSVDLVIKED